MEVSASSFFDQSAPFNVAEFRPVQTRSDDCSRPLNSFQTELSHNSSRQNLVITRSVARM
jgi:hypothetical protein